MALGYKPPKSASKSKATSKSVSAAKRVVAASKDRALAPGSRDPSQIAGPAPPAISTPAYATPAAGGAVTPIAAPPVVNDPFLSPTDLANQALDLADVSRYLDDVDLSVNNARTDAALKTSQIDQAEGKNLENADWNNAARGLANSSIKDQQKASLAQDAAASRSATSGNLANAEGYGSSAHLRADTVVRPAINTKYEEKAKTDAEERSKNQPVADTGAPAAPAAPSVPRITGTPGGVAQDRAQTTSSPSTIAEPGSPGSSSTKYLPVVKNGKFYHFYPKTGQYMFIRNT